MASIPTIRQELNVAGAPDQRGASAEDFEPGLGTELAAQRAAAGAKAGAAQAGVDAQMAAANASKALGSALGNASEALYEWQARKETTRAAVESTRRQAAEYSRVQEEIRSGTVDVTKTLERFDKESEKYSQGYETNVARNYLAESTASLRGDLMLKAAAGQSEVAAGREKTAVNEMVTTLGASSYSSPVDTLQNVKRLNDFLTTKRGYFPAKDLAEIRRVGAQEIARQGLMGLAVNNPVMAIQEAQSPRWNGLVGGDVKHRVIKEAEREIEHKRAEQDRQRAQAEAQEHRAEKARFSELLDTSRQPGALSDAVIKASGIKDPSMKASLYQIVDDETARTKMENALANQNLAVAEFIKTYRPEQAGVLGRGLAPEFQLRLGGEISEAIKQAKTEQEASQIEQTYKEVRERTLDSVKLAAKGISEKMKVYFEGVMQEQAARDAVDIERDQISNGVFRIWMDQDQPEKGLTALRSVPQIRLEQAEGRIPKNVADYLVTVLDEKAKDTSGSALVNLKKTDERGKAEVFKSIRDGQITSDQALLQWMRNNPGYGPSVLHDGREILKDFVDTAEAEENKKLWKGAEDTIRAIIDPRNSDLTGFTDPEGAVLRQNFITQAYPEVKRRLAADPSLSLRNVLDPAHPKSIIPDAYRWRRTDEEKFKSMMKRQAPTRFPIISDTSTNVDSLYFPKDRPGPMESIEAFKTRQRGK